MKTIDRPLYLERLIARRENGLIKIITGIRRCGKSYLLFNLYRAYLLSTGVKEEQIVSIALDDDANRQYLDPDALSAFLQASIKNEDEMFYIFLDEAKLAISEEERKGNAHVRLYGIRYGLLRRANDDV